MAGADRTGAAAPAAMIGDDAAWLRGLIDRACRNAENLGDHQIRFIDSMDENLSHYGDRTFFSERQRGFAQAIEAELDNAGVSRNPDDWE